MAWGKTPGVIHEALIASRRRVVRLDSERDGHASFIPQDGIGHTMAHGRGFTARSEPRQTGFSARLHTRTPARADTPSHSFVGVASLGFLGLVTAEKQPMHTPPLALDRSDAKRTESSPPVAALLPPATAKPDSFHRHA